ncbi:hypothetical protein J5277_29405 [Rhizobium sp. 16-449-1b]|uniref:hypothetical protein n=1 Tax=Rhizobium sp. 16-449-1b TaxID=2819989 RepID=UPI001ADBAFF5|nr:hypothetical protein [Rhizobium sp. 16-449-1b]MBO9198252.1 hypothetical protein [Rhizobium sp. 16-449-1b]
MSHDDNPAIDRVNALLAELGIVDPVAIADAQGRHAKVIAAYRGGRLTEAALRHSIARSSGETDVDTLIIETGDLDQNER